MPKKSTPAKKSTPKKKVHVKGYKVSAHDRKLPKRSR